MAARDRSVAGAESVPRTPQDDDRDTERRRGGGPRSAVVVGAGIFGLTAALALRRRGLEVTVVDAGPIPRPDGASADLSKAVRLDYGGDRFYTDLMVDAVAGWRAWNDLSGESLFEQAGIAFVTAGPLGDAGYEAESLACMEELGIAVERLDAAAIRDRLPGVRDGRFVDGYFNPTAGFARADRVLDWLAREARAHGCALWSEQPLVGLVDDPADGRVRGVRLGGGPDRAQLLADLVVLATGAWAVPGIPELEGLLRPTAQVVHYLEGVERAPECLWGADLARSGWFGFPTAAGGEDGLVKIANHGAGLGGRPGTEVPTEEVEAETARFDAFLRDVMPGLGGGRLARTRICFYADTHDGDFVIDGVPGRPGLVVATGGSGHAFKFAPRLGDLVAGAALDGKVSSRFAWRRPGIRGQGRGGEMARAGR